MAVFRFLSVGKGMCLVLHNCEWKVSNRVIQQQGRLSWGVGSWALAYSSSSGMVFGGNVIKGIMMELSDFKSLL